MEKTIIQYQVKYDKDLECGGGYVKIGPTQDDLKQFGDPTPYNVMFGPDKCGHNKRTHLIFNYKGKFKKLQIVTFQRIRKINFFLPMSS